MAVIMLHHAWEFSPALRMDTRTTSDKNLSAIAMSIGSKMCQALLAYHAFTGTDYRSAIIRIISVLSDRYCPRSIIKWSSVYEFMTETCRVRTKIVWIESYDQGHVGLFNCGLESYKLENWNMLLLLLPLLLLLLLLLLGQTKKYNSFLSPRASLPYLPSMFFL